MRDKTHLVLIEFEVRESMDALRLHECLCKAIHEQDPGSMNDLTDDVVDIEIVEKKEK